MFQFVLKVTRVSLCVDGYVSLCVEGNTCLLCVEGYVFYFVLKVTCFTLC